MNTLCIITILQERKIIIDSMPEGGPWQLNRMAQPVQHPAQTPPSTSNTHTYTHGLPHQDTVLHTNSGSNSILLGLHQQINRSSSVTGNHILAQNWKDWKASNEPQQDKQPCREANASTDSCLTRALRCSHVRWHLRRSKIPETIQVEFTYNCKSVPISSFDTFWSFCRLFWGKRHSLQ